jgi:hypothetical protein
MNMKQNNSFMDAANDFFDRQHNAPNPRRPITKSIPPTTSISIIQTPSANPAAAITRCADIRTQPRGRTIWERESQLMRIDHMTEGW